MVSNVSVQELTAESKSANVHLGAVSSEKLKLITKLNAVRMALDNSLEQSYAGWDTFCPVNYSVRSIFGQKIEVLDASTNQIETQLLVRTGTGFGGAYNNSQLLCPYSLTNISGAGTTSAEV